MTAPVRRTEGTRSSRSWLLVALASGALGIAVLATDCLPTREAQVDCPPPLARAAADAEPAARVGAYYFDGWAGPLYGFHFAGLADGPYDERMPLYGWRDRDPATMRQQLEWAATYGINFFVFDWYFRADESRNPFLNQALENYGTLRDHRGVGFALLYVNTRGKGGEDDFVVPRSQWRATAERWVTSHFVRRDYLRIKGKPVLFVLDSFGLTQQLGGDRGVNQAFAQLRATARKHGLPGVFVVAGVPVGAGFDWGRFGDAFAAQSYDAATQYAYPDAPGLRSGERGYGELIASASEMWDRFATTSPFPYLPTVMAGWDPRPWEERVRGHLFWYRRTPAQFERFVRDAIAWSGAHPRMRPAGERKPVVMIAAWNELGEGSYIVPTVADCHRYGDALARALRLARPPSAAR
jgi:hypothetical protein